ncbi:hypothetical protein TSAR_014484 [Trichomalopsis sarcophagae]|uniref:PWWP domain-containing protein n=1 Tax=Trichomalopsis sarcophagae TaxID=543379 RepID=A0A232EFD8_9HYME|nr:hypothetical protein TSAR_014484 [Trichomalopsis sarcophagae]
MCEQTEIHYLDGDVVWVKLGSSWWPGQVVGFEKLPEDVQLDFKNKPLIAAVKFFQEEYFQFVKNYQQIYKYNCTQKNDFIKKGLDKFRAKSKDGSNYMDKFPQDVKTAEMLTDGNPNILSSEKFNPEQKPDISGLFGDKKISKRKRTRDDSMKQIQNDFRRKVTHPRFLQENDHEIRIRQQPKHNPSAPSTSSSGSIFPCQICGFSATRVNVIICHLKSHRLNNETAATNKPKVKTNVHSKSRQTISDFSKRQYVKKTVPSKSKSETKVESLKRKHFKQIEKPSKKKKLDPELRKKLLADWNVESDEDESSDLRKSVDMNSTDLLIKDQSSIESIENTNTFKDDSSKDNSDNSDFLHESNKLLQETDGYAKLSTLKDVSKSPAKVISDENDMKKLDTALSPKRNSDNFQVLKFPVGKFPEENDDKNSRLSCFDFDEDDVPEPSISSVRKMTRGLGNKNMSIKKEIIKEFEMSQALKHDAGKDMKNDEKNKLNVTKDTKESCTANLDEEMLCIKDTENKETEENNEDKIKVDEKFNNCIEICETQVEILEIFEDHKEDENKYVQAEENSEKVDKKPDFQCEDIVAANEQSNTEGEITLRSKMRESETCSTKDHEMISDISTADVRKKSISPDDFIFENRDDDNIENTSNIKSVSQDLSQNSLSNRQNENNLNFCTQKRRERPKKNLTSSEEVTFDNEYSKIEKMDVDEFDRKTSESDSDHSSSSKIRKSSKKYQSSLYLQSFEHRSFQTDSLSKSNDKPEKINTKIKRTGDSENNSDGSVDDSIEGLKSPSNSNNDKTMIESESLESIKKHNSEIKEFATGAESILETKIALKSSNYNHLKEQSKIIEDNKIEEQLNNDVELLPPKKSQIKKFELSLIDSSDNSLSIHSLDSVNKSDPNSENLRTNYGETLSETPLSETLSEKIERSENVSKSDQADKCSSAVITNIKDLTSKTEEIEHPVKAIKNDELSLSEISTFDSSSITDEIKLDTDSKTVMQEPVITNYPTILPDNFGSIKVVVADNEGMEVKSNQDFSLTNDKSAIKFSNDLLNIEKSSSLIAPEILSAKKTMEPPVPISEINVAVPVKKREKPRIIQNVALKEPMILKTKLTEKHTAKFRKHKLEGNSMKLSDLKSSSNTKVMKMETVISNNKGKSSLSSSQSLVTKKISKTVKAEDRSSADDTSNETITDVSQTLLKVPSSEKFIQQSSQSLVDMELDIDSMPFVLSEDVLTPESIEQMPVVISSVLPTTPITSSLSTTIMTPTKQIVSANQSFQSPVELNDINLKKKSGTPAILKSKNKPKPMITSIKNVEPPLTSATYKGGYKVNSQALKKTLDNQKTPGKYVIVQTSGHQQTYSMHQKTVTPTSKGSGNAQIVQQGSKVVILTSPSSGQSGQKVLPLNSISKALTNRKIQRIVPSKQGQQIHTSANPQSLGGLKTVLTSKSGEFSNSPTSTKLTGQKIVSHQQLLASKSVLTQIPGTITKSTALSNVPQGIITKEGIFTPISASTIGGKTFISSKTLVAKGFPQSTSASKHILNPISQTFSGKTILNSQGIVSKGTVLTPITGSQVKALAAKNIKGSKSQCSTVQCKVQLIETQKNSKVPISLTQTHSSNRLVSQNSDIKTGTSTQKGIKQTIHKQATVAAVLPSSVVQQKCKVVSLNPEQKVGSPKTISRMIKLPAKVVKDKVVENVQHKQPVDKEILLLNSKIEQEKHVGCIPVMKSSKIVPKTLQKKITSASTATTSLSSNSNASLSINIPSLDPVNHEKEPKKEITEQPTVPSTQTVTVSENEKINVSKMPSQAQIMAMPTENSDGTQSLVLFTVDEQGQGHIIPLDNNALVSLDGSSTIDGSRTIYIDSSSLGESGNMDNIVLQIDNSSLSNFQPTTSPVQTPAVVTETVPSSDISQSTNQDILAAALANTDFQSDGGIVETTGTTAMTSFTQTSLINQTILQSTIIPPIEPISSPSVLETSLTLNQPIMTPLEVPSSLSPQAELIPVSSTTVIPQSLKVPLSIAENSGAIKKILNTSEERKKDSQTESKLVSNESYSTSISGNDFGNKRMQITPSMPLIDDNFNANNGFDSTNASVVTEDNLRSFVTKTSEELIQDLTGNDSLQENNETTLNESTCSSNQKESLKIAPIILNDTQDDSVSSQHNMALTIETSEETVITGNIQCSNEIDMEILNKESNLSAEICTASIELPKIQSSHEIQQFGVIDHNEEKALAVTESTVVYEEETLTSNEDLSCELQSIIPLTEKCGLKMVVTEDQKSVEVKEEKTSSCQISDSLQKSDLNCISTKECKMIFEDDKIEASQEAPSQSYEQLVSDPVNVPEVPSQSVKSENSREATESLTYEAMKVDNNTLIEDPPTQSYKDSKSNEASQSFEILHEMNTNAPTQSFNEMIEINKARESMNQSTDDPNFPTQSYEVEKLENCTENLETDTEEISQEGNIPSQSNDIVVDGIGTSSMSTNNSGLNEDETASSSYVPETPENQERDQDQESAISTSSYEIPPCEELNIASSSVIPDTSVQSEHSSIHNNGVPEIPTSSYNLNPDSSSAHVDAVPTSSYEDQIIIEQNVSTSHEVPISIANVEETGSQSYVTDSSNERNEPTSYYRHNQEVTESYYQNICKQSHSQIESNSEEEATPSYYESNPVDVTSEASGSYFNQEEATPSYSHEISPSYYDPQAESEASQSYYSSAHDLNASSQSVALQNVEATQSFYSENSDEQQFRQQGEATPTYTEHYSVDYAHAPVSSPLDRHDLVESSVPPRSMDR